MNEQIVASVAEESVGAPCTKLEVKDPAMCIAAVSMLANGEPPSAIKEVTGISNAGLAALRYRHSDAIDVRRMRAADDAENLAERVRLLAVEKASRLEEDPSKLDDASMKDLMLSYGIARDKASGLRGDPTAVIKHEKGVNLEDAKEAIEAARKKINGEVIDVG